MKDARGVAYLSQLRAEARSLRQQRLRLVQERHEGRAPARQPHLPTLTLKDGARRPPVAAHPTCRGHVLQK